MALGRGLSALIPDKQETATDSSQMLDISLIKDNRFQPRQNYDELKLEELMVSIKEKGFLQPIVVRKVREHFEVIAGERRLKAARKLGLEKIPVVVKEASDKEALVLALVENVQREELNPVEKAESYRRLCQEFGFTQEEVAKAVGKDRATVANLLRLLKLPKEILDAVFDGKITEGHARALLAADDANAQKIIFLETLQKGLSVRDVEERVKKLAGKAVSSTKRAPIKDPEMVSLEDELRGIFGTKVTVDNRRGNKGKLVIEYYSLNDFDRIMKVVRK